MGRDNKLVVKSINLPGGGSWTGPVTIGPPPIIKGGQTSGSIAKGIKLFKPKIIKFAKGGYAKKVRKPQKK